MKQQILFIQGGGDDGYNAGKGLVNSLEQQLGDDFQIHYPELQSDENKPDVGWIKQIEQHVADIHQNGLIVAHSLGASMLLKYLSEHKVPHPLKAIFLLATPYWSGTEDWKAGLKLAEDFENNLPGRIPIYLYHCKDDEEVPFSQFEKYRELLPNSIFWVFETGGHLFTNKLGLLVLDISSEYA